MDFVNSESPAAYKIFLTTAMLGGITFGILIGIDALECFLHALRLHWVEFQCKFYHADGYLFVPMSFRALVPPVA